MNPKFSIKAVAEGPVEVLVYDEIINASACPLGGVCAGEFVEAVQPFKDRDILVRINSRGGDVFGAIGMHNYLRSLLNVSTIIDGQAASSASIVALSAPRERRSIAPSGSIMIHEPRSGVMGTSVEMRKLADTLDKATATMLGIYTAETTASSEEIISWMGEEKTFSAEEALAAGFVGRVTGSKPTASMSAISKDSMNSTQTTMAALTAAAETPVTACGCNSGQQKVRAEEDDLVAKLKAEIDDLKAQLKAFQDKADTDTKARASVAIEAAIADGRIQAVARDIFLASYMASEATTLAVLTGMAPPSAQPRTGTKPLNHLSLSAGSQTLTERIEAESDVQKRVKMRMDNWQSLITSPRQ